MWEVGVVMNIAINNDKLYIYDNAKLEPVKSFGGDFNKMIGCLSKKERLLKAKSMIMVDSETNTVIATYPIIRSQHFYPLSITDFAYALKDLMLKKIDSLPILSLDSHDYNYCDFNCKDCLAVDTREWAKENLGFTNIDPEEYEKILKKIAEYSKERGCDSIRFEMSGEGNPDMYPHRSRIMKYAREECNMQLVYISSGSMLNDQLIDDLAKYCSYIRISLPGVTEEAYDKYSSQTCANKYKFTLQKSLDNIKKLIEKRKEYNRDGELIIGARTCMRPESDGGYLETAKKLKELGADSFQVVQILVPEGSNYKDYPISDMCRRELQELNKNNIGLMHIQIPGKLDYVYYEREMEVGSRPGECFSSLFAPILYGPHLVVCTHWEKIKNLKYHYGKIDDNVHKLSDIMQNENAKAIRKDIPYDCSSCCSIYDNQILCSIKAQLMLMKNIENVEFLLTY